MKLDDLSILEEPSRIDIVTRYKIGADKNTVRAKKIGQIGSAAPTHSKDDNWYTFEHWHE